MQLGQLTDKQLQAAKLVAKGGKFTIAQIAEAIGVSTRTIDYWKTDETFKAEVHRLKNLWRLTVRTAGVADPEIRLHDLNDLRNRLFGVIYARAMDPAMQNVPGGKTGLMVKSYKMRGIGQGDAVAEEEYKLDAGLISAILAVRRATVEELNGSAGKDGDTAEDMNQKVVDILNEARRRAAEAKRSRAITIQKVIEQPGDHS